MPSRYDNLKECHASIARQVRSSLPIDDFIQSYCVRCQQPECTRSVHGKTRFDQRVSTWEDRLFLKVPRMDPGDPRFESISRQDFAPVQESLSVHGWGQEEPTIPKEILPDPPPDPVIEETREPVAREPTHFKAVQTDASISRETLLINTSNSGEQYLPGATTGPSASQSPKKKVDSWDAPEQSVPSEVVVKAGATIRFGS